MKYDINISGEVDSVEEFANRVGLAQAIGKVVYASISENDVRAAPVAVLEPAATPAPAPEKPKATRTKKDAPAGESKQSDTQPPASSPAADTTPSDPATPPAASGTATGSDVTDIVALRAFVSGWIKENPTKRGQLQQLITDFCEDKADPALSKISESMRPAFKNKLEAL